METGSESRPAQHGVGSLVFDLWSRFYDLPLLQRMGYQPVHDAVIKGVREESPARVADIGCGTGLLTTRLNSSVRGTVVGLDFSPGMLDRAVARAPAVRWVRGDALHLPFASGAFDTLCCTESFHWYPDQAGAAVELGRVLAPGGRLFLALMSLPYTTGFGPQVRWPARDQLAQMLGDAGLEVVEQRRVHRPPGGLLLSALLTVARRPG